MRHFYIITLILHQVALLVAGLRKDCQDVIQEGCSGVVWESYKVDPYVKKISDQFYAFQDRVEELLLTDEEVIISPFTSELSSQCACISIVNRWVVLLTDCCRGQSFGDLSVLSRCLQGDH